MFRSLSVMSSESMPRAYGSMIMAGFGCMERRSPGLLSLDKGTLLVAGVVSGCIRGGESDGTVQALDTYLLEDRE